MRERKNVRTQRIRERGLPIAPLTYFTLISPFYSIHQVAIAVKIASSFYLDADSYKRGDFIIGIS